MYYCVLEGVLEDFLVGVLEDVSLHCLLEGILDGVLDDVYDIILDGLYILDGNADGSGLFVNGVYFETLTFF